MPTRKSRGKSAARATSKDKGQVGSERAVGTTVSGPSHPTASLTEVADHAAEQQALAEAMPFNSAKRFRVRCTVDFSASRGSAPTHALSDNGRRHTERKK